MVNLSLGMGLRLGGGCRCWWVLVSSWWLLVVALWWWWVGLGLGPSLGMVLVGR